VQDLKRPGPRLIIAAWVMLIVPLLGTELTLVILNGPALVRTLARALSAGGQAAVAQFGAGPRSRPGWSPSSRRCCSSCRWRGLAYILCRVSRTTFRRGGPRHSRGARPSGPWRRPGSWSPRPA